MGRLGENQPGSTGGPRHYNACRQGDLKSYSGGQEASLLQMWPEKTHNRVFTADLKGINSTTVLEENRTSTS